MDVQLRTLEEQDALTSWRWRNDKEVWASTRFRPDREITVEIELEWIRTVLSDPSSRRFAILADGQYVGNIYLTDIADGAAEYHVFIGERSMWGRGVARAASRRLIEFARDVLGLSRIHLLVRTDNVRAVAMYEGLGFVRKGAEDGFIQMDLALTLRGE